MNEGIERERQEKISAYLLIYLAVSFLGWVWETVFVSVRAGCLRDRGLLALPVCPVYGNGVLLLYLLLGTPHEGRGLIRKMRSPVARYASYFLASLVIPTAVELLIGLAMDKLFSRRLWNYKKYPLNLDGYICVSASLVWAVGAVLFMRFVFPAIKKLVFSMPREKMLPSAAALGLASVIDLTVSLISSV